MKKLEWQTKRANAVPLLGLIIVLLLIAYVMQHPPKDTWKVAPYIGKYRA